MPCPARHCSCVARQCANRDRSTQVQKTCRRSSKTGTSPPFLPLTKPRRQIRCSESWRGMEAREADFALGLHPGSLFQGTQNWLQALHKSEKNQKIGLIPGSERFPGGGHGDPLQHSFLDNPMDRGAWQAIVHRVAKSQTQLKWLSTHTLKNVSLSVIK